jgi:hypothetical protein
LAKADLDVKGNRDEDQVAFLRAMFFGNDSDVVNSFGILASLSHRPLPGQLIDEGLKKYMVRSLERNRPKGEQFESLAGLFVGTVMKNRSLFITKGGIIGSAANAVEIGDKVCVIFGCACPVVLRAKDDGYVVVGDAYVDGVEAVDAETVLEKGNYKAEKFDIR